MTAWRGRRVALGPARWAVALSPLSARQSVVGEPTSEWCVQLELAALGMVSLVRSLSAMNVHVVETAMVGAEEVMMEEACTAWKTGSGKD